MAVHVALLRAINLGSTRRVPMADLRGVLADAGYGDAITHLQTGNVVLSSPAGESELEASIEELLAQAFGFDIPVIARSASRLEAILARNPFLEQGLDPGTLHVSFLKRTPATEAAGLLAAADFGEERSALVGTELYLHYPNGMGRSKMSGAFLERTLRVPGTVRTWKVVTKLAELSAAARA